MAAILPQVIQELMDENYEVVKIYLRPSRLPRGMPGIVFGNVYHLQTDKGAFELRSYLYEFMATIESPFPSCGILITGELNRLDTSGFRNAFTLKQVVKFPTRGNRTLDLILTNLSEYYEDPVKRLAFGLSDHPSIEVQPVYRFKQPKAKQYIFSRDLTTSKQVGDEFVP